MQNRIAVNPADPVLIRNFQGETFSGLFPGKSSLFCQIDKLIGNIFCFQTGEEV